MSSSEKHTLDKMARWFNEHVVQLSTSVGMFNYNGGNDGCFRYLVNQDGLRTFKLDSGKKVSADSHSEIVDAHLLDQMSDHDVNIEGQFSSKVEPINKRGPKYDDFERLDDGKKNYSRGSRPEPFPELSDEEESSTLAL